MPALGVFDFPFTFRSWTGNAHRSTAGALIPGAGELDTFRIERFDPSRVQIRDQREPQHLIAGGDLGDASKTFRYISVAGTILATTPAKLDDAISALLSTFDIDECQLASPTTEGILPFTFYSPTDIATYTPYQKERFYVRPAGFPAIPERRSSGLAIPFAVELVCADPRRYRDTETSIVLNSGNSWSATCPNWNSTVGVHVFPVITIAMTGAGSSSFALNFGAEPIANTVINLSGCVNTDVVTLDCATGRLKKNGTDAASLRTSAVATAMPYIPAGGSAFNAANVTNVGSVTATYRQARG